MLATIRSYVEVHTGGLTDGQFFGYGLLLVLSISAIVHRFVGRAKRDDRIDYAYEISRLHDEEQS